MTWYVTLEPMQEPFDVGLDDAGRIQLVFNVMAECQYTGTFVDELGKRLQDSGVGTMGTNIFLSSRDTLPQSGGPYLMVIETGGAPPSKTHNEINPPAYIRPSAQIKVTGGTYPAVRTMINSAYLALNVRNTTLSS